MSRSLTKPAVRMPAESFRTVSHPTPVQHDEKLPVRTVSQPLRIDAKSEYLSALNETRQRLGKSIEAMALDADCPTSSMSDALAGKEGRNFAGHWLTAQGQEFEDVFNAVMEERRGTSPKAKRLRAAKALGELVQRVVEELP